MPSGRWIDKENVAPIQKDSYSALSSKSENITLAGKMDGNVEITLNEISQPQKNTCFLLCMELRFKCVCERERKLERGSPRGRRTKWQSLVFMRLLWKNPLSLGCLMLKLSLNWSSLNSQPGYPSCAERNMWPWEHSWPLGWLHRDAL